MFTGIVSELGQVIAVNEGPSGRQVVIRAPATTDGLAVGDSVAVNGVCLTAVAVADERFTVDVVRESLDRSNLGSLVASDGVDLERPTVAGGRFDGHIVQGHVDGVGTVKELSAEGESRRLRVEIPASLAPYVVEKGSITIDGVSLTVTAVSPPRAAPAWLEVVLIPHTLAVTVLGRRVVGDRVNLEVDVIAKYVERLMEART